MVDLVQELNDTRGRKGLARRLEPWRSLRAPARQDDAGARARRDHARQPVCGHLTAPYSLNQASLSATAIASSSSLRHLGFLLEAVCITPCDMRITTHQKGPVNFSGPGTSIVALKSDFPNKYHRATVEGRA